MSYCQVCGEKLITKKLNQDGEVPYCPKCQQFRFPGFNVAVSTIIRNKLGLYLLTRQYHKPDYILIAGYVTKGESAEETLVREVKEETNLDVVSYNLNSTKYYAKSNTLMINFTCLVEGEIILKEDEVNEAIWVDAKEAIRLIKPNSLAKYFLESYMNNVLD